MVSASAQPSRTQIGVVYFAGVVQGLALVTFPAASAIFTRPDGFDRRDGTTPMHRDHSSWSIIGGGTKTA